MPLTDEDLFAFDHDELANFDLAKAQRTLEEQPEAYRAQLVAALWIDGWRERIALHEKSSSITGHDETWLEGFDYAAREMAAHLRQGDLLPGGVLHHETDRDDSERQLRHS